jgi:hypothetical protein
MVTGLRRRVEQFERERTDQVPAILLGCFKNAYNFDRLSAGRYAGPVLTRRPRSARGRRRRARGRSSARRIAPARPRAARRRVHGRLRDRAPARRGARSRCYCCVNSAVFECVHVATRAVVAVKLLFAIANEPGAEVESHAMRDR